MNTQNIELVWGEVQTNHDFTLSATDRASAKLAIPSTAVEGSNHSVATYEHGSAPFKATVRMTQKPDDFSDSPIGPTGGYGPVARDFHFQIGGIAPPGTSVVVVNPGEVWYFNVTLAHDGKTGGGSGQVYTAAYQLRT